MATAYMLPGQYAIQREFARNCSRTISAIFFVSFNGSYDHRYFASERPRNSVIHKCLMKLALLAMPLAHVENMDWFTSRARLRYH